MNGQRPATAAEIDNIWPRSLRMGITWKQDRGVCKHLALQMTAGSVFLPSGPVQFEACVLLQKKLRANNLGVHGNRGPLTQIPNRRIPLRRIRTPIRYP